MTKTYTAYTHPSLAFVKYWGKSYRGKNIPLTSSLAMAINRFTTTVSVHAHSSPEKERITCDDKPTPDAIYLKNYHPFFDYCRHRFRCPKRFWEVVIKNDYPLAAGLASSSAIYAGLALAINASCNDDGGQNSNRRAAPLGIRDLSAVARYGSASAARSLFGGTVCLPAHHTRAHCYAENGDWPELRLIVARCSTAQKPISSREAMNRSKTTSPLFRHWQRNSAHWYREARRACATHDLERLGWAMQQSYLTMFATMHTASPPIFYWNEQSVAVIKQSHLLRTQGVAIWETMDAGPQVKLLTTDAHLDAALRGLKTVLANDHLITSELGAPPSC